MHVRVRVRTGAKKEGTTALPDGRFDIAVREKPEEGKANERVVELVARHFGVAQKFVRIIRGRTSPSKTLAVRVP
jgi:uncharacterized protein (TIGR00251 family)